MKIIFAWQWRNSLDVIARFPREEGIGLVLSEFAKEGHEVWLSTWGGPLYGKDGQLHYDLIPEDWGYDAWVERIARMQPDLILGWGSVDHKIYPKLRIALPKTPIAYFLAGGPIGWGDPRTFDVMFVETDFHVRDLADVGVKSVRALGIAADIMTPVPQGKQWDVIFPASFTSNKRYDLFCETIKKGRFSACTPGPVNERALLELSKKSGATTLGYTPRDVLRDLYCASRVTVLTGGAWGGSQRTLLESLACGIPVISCDDNFQLDWLKRIGAPVTFVPPSSDFLVDAVHEVLANPPDPVPLRQFVLDHFTGRHYYDAVLSGLKLIAN